MPTRPRPARPRSASRLVLTGLPLALLAVAPAAPAADPADRPDWDQWRGPDRSGVWGGPLPKSLAALSLGWETPLGPSYSGPVTDGTTVYTTETVDESFERVVAFDLATGDRRWEGRLGGTIDIPGYAAANGAWIKSTPALGADAAGPVLVVLGMRDELFCLDRDTGERRWAVDLADRFGTRRPSFGGVCSPLIDTAGDGAGGDGAVYVMGGGATLKLSLADGATVWRTLADEGNDDDALSSPVLATLGGVRQLLVQTRTRLCGVDPKTGGLLWSERIEARRNANVLTPTVLPPGGDGRDRVFTASRGGGARCFAVGRDGGGGWTVEEVWNARPQAYMASPVTDGATIFLHTTGDRLTALDAATGDTLWTSPPAGDYETLVLGDGVLLALSSAGELRAVAPARDGYRELDARRVAEDSWAHLGVFDGGLLVRDLGALKVYRY